MAMRVPKKRKLFEIYGRSSRRSDRWKRLKQDRGCEHHKMNMKYKIQILVLVFWEKWRVMMNKESNFGIHCSIFLSIFKNILSDPKRSLLSYPNAFPQEVER